MVSITHRPRFTPGERTPVTHWIGEWVGLRAGLDTETKEERLEKYKGSKQHRGNRT
jgi:hypothetical protein